MIRDIEDGMHLPKRHHQQPSRFDALGPSGDLVETVEQNHRIGSDFLPERSAIVVGRVNDLVVDGSLIS